MTHFIPLLTFLLFSLPLFTFSQSQRSCSTMDLLEIQLQENPALESRMQEIQEFTQRYIQTHNPDGQRAAIDIPVVVHVVYRTSSENVSLAQIQSQLAVLNADFGTKGLSWPEAANVDIGFCLATVDPSGAPTDGIIRVNTRKRSFSYTNDGVKFAGSGGSDAWPASDYLNMWVCNLGSGLLGYAQFPGGNAATDGVVIDYAYFGTIGTATAPFDLGRTATHEVGHWLGLRHIWGDGGCSVDDNIADTRLSDGPNYGCPTGHVSCGSLDMIENYMDYTDDACMDMFTEGQKAAMLSYFSPGGERESLLSSNGCGTGTAPTCSDGLQNGNETGVDCGGPDCAPCATGGCDAPVVSASAGKKKITLSWGAANGALSYTAYLGPVGGPYTSKTVTSTSVNYGGLSSNTTYEYYVESNCSSGTAASNPATTSTTRVLPGTAPITVYPVPANNFLVIEFGDIANDQVDIILMDVVGKKVFSDRNVEVAEGYIEINLSTLESGVYFVKVRDGSDAEHIRKIVINR